MKSSRGSSKTRLHAQDPATQRNIVLVRRTLARLDVAAKKSLGQNFLVDDGVLATILHSASLSNEEDVIEVGPGLGVLTRELSCRARRVVAVEMDDILADYLATLFSDRPNVEIIHSDILKTNPWLCLSEPRRYKVVANLPYNVAFPTILHFLKANTRPDALVIMVQKEVAQGLAPAPGKAGVPGMIVEYYATSKIVAEVGPDCFFPAPRVSSAIVRLIPRAVPPVEIGDPESFFDFIGRSFAQPRKQLHNSMARGLGIAPSRIAALLEREDIDRSARPQELLLPHWAALWKRFQKEQTDGNADR